MPFRLQRANFKKRTKQFLMLFTQEEHEFLVRHCFKHSIKIGPYIRRRAVPFGWRLELNDLRETQKDTPLIDMTPQHGQRGPRHAKGASVRE